MFEAQVAYYLNRYLGQYVEGIDQRSLAISIYAGNVVLKNLRLKADALAEFDLPITVTGGLLGSLTLKVPWSSLGRVPVEVEIDRLFILATPKKEASQHEPAKETADDIVAALEKAFQQAKLQRVGRQEAQWVEEIQALQAKKSTASVAADKAATAGDAAAMTGSGAGGFLRGLIDTILGNLQLSISNVHVRYEDDVTNEGHPFACGFTLAKIVGTTVDEAGRPAFVTTSPLDLLRKALSLRRVALYFDCDTPGWNSETDWRKLAPEGWANWFLPGVEGAEDSSHRAAKREYVMQPVDGRATYVRRGRNVQRDEHEAAAEIDFTLDSIALGLTQAQYRSYSLLLAEFSVFTARLPQTGYRPRERPAAGKAARRWWWYAVLAVKQQTEARRLTWRQTVKFALMRKHYVPLYIEYLKRGNNTQSINGVSLGAPAAGEKKDETPAAARIGQDATAEAEANASGTNISKSSSKYPQKIVEMDESLPERTILMFRRLAYAEVERDRRREARRAAAAGRSSKKEDSHGGGWLAWITGAVTGGGQTGGLEATPELKLPPAEGELVGQQRADLSSEEYSKLLEFVEHQEEGLKLGVETPYTLLTQVRVQIGLASAVLHGPEGSFIVRGSLEGIAADAHIFPVTRRVNLAVTAMGVENQEGVFIQSGAAAVGGSRTPTMMDRASSMAVELREVTGDRALSVSFLQQPQDNSADAIVDVVLTPSYVYYSADTVQRVTEFFKPPDSLINLDFSGLGAAASSQLERARRAAAEYAAAALSSKPRLKMRLDLEAPKIAVPASDTLGEISLAVDLGRFVIESDPSTAASLSTEEAGLYECIRVAGSNVSAYLVDGTFDWRQYEEENATGDDTGSRGRRILVPLLQRCRLEMGLQAARYPEPRYPRLRMSPTIPLLHFHLSPGRVSRMLRVLKAVTGGPEESDEAQGIRIDEVDGSKEAWRQHAAHEGPVKMLTWTGMGRSTATWVPRHAVLYRGKMYLYDTDTAKNGPLNTVPIWPEYTVVRLPPDHVGGCPHAFAIRPSRARDLRVADDSDSTVLRCDSEEATSEWYRSLLADQHSLDAEIEGGVAPPLDDEWDSASTMALSLSDAEDYNGRESRTGSSKQEDRQKALEDGLMLQIDAKLGELAIFGSGREPTSWWPPSGGSSPEPPTEDLTQGCTSVGGMKEAAHAEEVDGEVALVIVRASGGMMSMEYGATQGTTIQTGLASLDILDMLTGRRSASRCFLACSVKPEKGAVEVGEDVFFDAVQGSSGRRTKSPSRVTPPQDDESKVKQQDLAEFTLKIRRPGSEDYNGVDTLLEVTLNQLYFFCNRPTVAALISMGTDLAAAASSDTSNNAVLSTQEGGSEVLPLVGGQEAGMDLASRGTEAERKIFALRATLRTLQVVFNYEGQGTDPLDDALVLSSIDDFQFDFSLAPNGGMSLTSSLGNLIAEDCTLPKDHPYRHTCGLRPGSAVSLVEVQFGFHPKNQTELKVPRGVDFYSLKARLSELQLVFLYRFIQEILQYLTTMLAMRLPPALGSGAGEVPSQLHNVIVSEEEEATHDQVTPQQTLQQQPFVLVMDIEMNAPVILIPASSHSLDAIDVDLGDLRLASSILAGDGGSHCLVEAVDLSFSGVGCTVIQSGRRGHSVIKNPEQGWSLQWRRPLSAERGDIPFFELALDVPYIRASLSDIEYLLMTSVVSSNVAEAPVLPPGAQWIADRHTDHVDTVELQRTKSPISSSLEMQTSPLQSPRQVLGSLALQRTAPPTSQGSRTNIRTVISLGEIELELRRTVEGLPAPLPLARFAVADLQVAFRNTDSGSMHVQLCVPKVEAQDLRADVPLEQSLVISSGHKASFLMLQWDASPGMVDQHLAVTLQKPLFVAEFSFLLAVTRFILPTVTFNNSNPIPFASHDLLLTGDKHTASSDLYLSPAVRLLVDSPVDETISDYSEYNGAGHALVLPSRDHMDELLPLILVGSGRTLRLRNVTIVNADALPACLQLAPGGKLIAQPGDGVKMLSSGDVAKLRSPPQSPRKTGGTDPPGQALAKLSPRKQQQQSDEQSQPGVERSIKISLTAVGVGFQLMQLEGVRGDASTTRQMTGKDSVDRLSRKSSAPDAQGMANLSEQLRQQQPVHRSPSAASSTSLSAASALEKSFSIRLLAVMMDVQAEYESRGLTQRGNVDIQGLRAESRTIADIQHELVARSEQSLARHRKLQGRTEATVLQPCRLTLGFALVSETDPDGTGTTEITRTDVDLKASDMRLTVSPAVLELATLLGSGVIAPLMQPGPDVPVRGVGQFERIWTFDPEELWHKSTELAVSLSPSGVGGGISVWRPRAPIGYGMVGHVITPGDAKPSFEVLVVAINSGLAAYPVTFKKVWAGAGATIWRPVAPDEYVAVGDVFSRDEGEPDLSSVLCLHKSTVVEVPVGECLSLPPALPQAPAAGAVAAAALAPVDLWCVDNCMGTFLAFATEEDSAMNVGQICGRDLRSPVGLTPAALVASSDAVMTTRGGATTRETSFNRASSAQQQHMLPRLQLITQPRQLQDRFVASRRQKRTEETRRSLTPAIVDFHRVWTDNGVYTKGRGVSFWRPHPPPGYAALGDCAVQGLEPPPSCLVVRDDIDSERDVALGGRSRRGMPLAKTPRGFELVWSDGNPRPELRVCFWRPIPPEGYLAMGCLVTIGETQPQRMVKCLRSDAVSRAGPVRSAVWSVRREERTLPPFSIWTADEALWTFVVETGERPAPLEERHRLHLDGDLGGTGSGEVSRRGPNAGEKSSKGVNIVLSGGSLSVLLVDVLNTPLLEVETTAVSAGVHGPSRQVVQAYVGLHPGITAYNRALRHWEPVLEPLDVVLNCEANLGPKLAHGLEPGINISIKSSAEMVYSSLAMTHVVSVLSALQQWRALHEQGQFTAATGMSSLMTSGAASVATMVTNALGIDAAMELDYGSRLGLVSIQSGSSSQVIRPLAQHPKSTSTAPIAREFLPHELLLIDIGAIVISGKESSNGASSLNRMFCRARLEGVGVDGVSAPQFNGPGSGPRTRSVRPKNIDNNKVVNWGERLVLPLPSRPSPSHGVVLEIWDGDAAGGRGKVLGRATFKVSPGDLREKEAHELEIVVEGITASIRGFYMLQRQWQGPSTSSVPTTHGWSASRTTVGDRALSLASQPGSWIVIPGFGRQRAQGSGVQSTAYGGGGDEPRAEDTTGIDAVSSIIPLRVGSEGLIVEGSFKNGTWHELLRAPCQLINSTRFTLEACLVLTRKEDTGWHVVGSQDALGKISTERPEEESEAVPARQVVVLGRAAPGEKLPLPLGWHFPGRQLAVRPVMTTREEDDNTAEEWWSTAPERGDDEMTAEPEHEWSVGTSGGRHAVLLDELDESVTRLVCCTPVRAPERPSGFEEQTTYSAFAGEEAHSAPPSLATLWFSITVESEVLASAGEGAEPIVDWRIVIAPPLTLVSNLPMPSSLIVWEHPISTADASVARVTQRLASGAALAVYTADMRRTVSLTVYPDGYDWADPSPVVISTGQTGSLSQSFVRTPPPDRFRIVRPGSKHPVEVFVKREFHMGLWLLEAEEELDSNRVVAQGVPLEVSLLAPLWVVNATSLAIDAVVVQVPPPMPVQAKKKEQRTQTPVGGGNVLAAARVLRTSNIGLQQQQMPSGRRTVAPASLELLSYPLPSFMGGTGAGPSSSTESAHSSASQRRQYYGVRLRVAGSGWTPPMALDVVESPQGSSDAAVGQTLQNAQPVLIQAEATDYGVVHEVVARLEVTPFKNSQVLRLETHVVLTNRTAVPLQLLQCRSCAAPSVSSTHGVTMAPAASAPAGIVVPEGGLSFVPGATLGVNALPVADAPGPPLVRASLRSVSGREDATDSFGWEGARHGVGLDEGRVQRWRSVPSLLPAAALVQLPLNAQRAQRDRGAVLDVPAGAAAIPMHLIRGLDRHVLCFRYAARNLVEATDVSNDQVADSALWSRPVAIDSDRDERYFVVIPVHAQGGDGRSQGKGSSVPLGAAGLALLRVSVHPRGSGAMHIVLESINCEPPFLLENRTQFPLHYRQANVPKAPFHTLAAWSAVGYAWEYSIEGAPSGEIEVQEGMGVGASEVYQLEATGEGRARSLPLSGPPFLCTVRVGWVESVAMSNAGVVAIAGDAAGGGALGRGGIDRLLQIAPGRDPLVMAGLKGVASPPPEVTTTIEVPGLEVSVVDDTPQEVVLVTVGDLKVVLSSGTTPHGPFTAMKCTVGHIQADNQLSGLNRYPVAFSSPREASGVLPMFTATTVMQMAGTRGRSFFPFIGARFPEGAQVAISEPLVWRLVEIGQRVAHASGQDDSGDTAAADAPLRIRHLVIGDVMLSTSFQGDPLSRPRHVVGGVVAMIIDLANFQSAAITLHGIDRTMVSTIRSAFINDMIAWIQGELFGIALSLVRNFGVIGGASRILGILSAGVAKLSGDQRGSSSKGSTGHRAGASTVPARSITDVGDGLLEGAGAFGTSLLRGIRGLVEKPLQGAKAAGLEGAVKGVAKGLVGVVINPVSGALDALSATAEGFDATFSSRAREEKLVTTRRRLPRVVSGDGKLLPLLRAGSEREAVIEQLGQALLWATLLATPAAAAEAGGSDGTSIARWSAGVGMMESYEEHFVLPNGYVALLTNRSLLLVIAPRFAQLDGAAEVGALRSADVPAGEVQWVIRWQDVLHLELTSQDGMESLKEEEREGRSKPAVAEPDRLVVHRKGEVGTPVAPPLVRVISCFPNTPQASQLKFVAERVLRKYYQDPVRRDIQWSERHAARAALPSDQPPEQLPLTLPSLDFRPTWHTNPTRPPVVYFWKAVAPPGYKPVGDVATLGDEAPLHPVPCFRDDVALRAAIETEIGTPGNSRPPTASPVEFKLVWRYNGQRAVSIWMPVAPEGFRALGAVVVGAPSEPAVDEYLCVREDLTAPARVFDSPIWAYDPTPALVARGRDFDGGRQAPMIGRGVSIIGTTGAQIDQPETWKVAVWPVDSRLGTFLAVRALNRPPGDSARAVTEVEQRSLTRQAR